MTVASAAGDLRKPAPSVRLLLWGPRRRLRRHRHQPALCVEGQPGRISRAKCVTNLEIMGILSLIFWSLVLVVTVKYVLLILLADNRGEGGILALMALAQRVVGRAAACATC